MELVYTPSGQIAARESPADAEPAAGDPRMSRIAKSFAAGQGEGLWLLAAERFDGLSPGVSYWRDFASRYMTALCQTPETAELEAIPPPGQGELATLLLSVPPMPGAEYLSEEHLRRAWEDLDAYTRAAVAAEPEGLSGLLKRRAPLWHQVGRVCFHLAENRRDRECPFAFLATYAPGVGAGARIQYQPLSRALRESAGARNKQALVRLLSPVQRAAERSAVARDLVESGDLYQPLAWTPRQAYRFLQETPVFEESGILVRLPDWWKKRPRPRVGVTLGSKAVRRFDAGAMLDFQVQKALGDQVLTEAEWRQLMAAEDGLVLLRGQWVEVDHQKLQEVLDHWRAVQARADDGVSFIEGMRLLAGAPADLADDTLAKDDTGEWSFVHAGPWLGELLAQLRDPQTLEAARPPSDFRASLRTYQETGVNWLWFLSRLGLGACLADDMGLGKTVQVLALLAALKGQGAGASLLVLPASLVGNWRAEIQRFAPSLRALFVHPSETPKEELARLASDPGKATKNVDVVLTTYAMLSRQKWLLDVPWRLVVLDEAQAIKNPAAQQTRTVKRLKAGTRIALSGTPVENRLGDLWSLFDFLCPGLLGNQSQFKQFAKALEQREKNRYAPLRALVQPYILRRLKTDRRIIDDLPEKTEVRAYCGLSKRQTVLYARLVKELADALENVSGIQRRGLVLAYLMRFKQLCNHPSQWAADGQFSPGDSGKFLRLQEIAAEIADRQEKALVFTQFREMTEPLAAFLAKVFGRAGLVLHGTTAVGRRKALVDQFQHDEGPPFFVLSLKAGGTGLNLTAASHVIHFDRWWNPAVENQATDRAFRIGQRRNVLVHKFVCQGTIEERIDAMIEEKSQLASELLEGGAERLLTEMSDAELIRFVSLDVSRAASVEEL